MSNNLVKDWVEFDRLQSLGSLVELLMVGNPLEEKHSTEGDWRDRATKTLPNLKKLDGKISWIQLRIGFETVHGVYIDASFGGFGNTMELFPDFVGVGKSYCKI